MIAEKVPIYDYNKTYKTSEFVCFVSGWIILPFIPIIGVILVVTAIVISLTTCDTEVTAYVCENCGNFVSPVSRQCDCCKAQLIDAKKKSLFERFF